MSESLRDGDLFLETWKASYNDKERGWLEVLFQTLQSHFEPARLDRLYGYGYWVGRLKACFIDECWNHGVMEANRRALIRTRKFYREVVD